MVSKSSMSVKFGFMTIHWKGSVCEKIGLAQGWAVPEKGAKQEAF